MAVIRSFQLSAPSFQRIRAIRGEGAESEKPPMRTAGSSKKCSREAAQVPHRTIALPESRWKLEAGSWKLSSHFLRKRVAQPVEHEVPEQEPHHRDPTEEDQIRQVADRA